MDILCAFISSRFNGIPVCRHKLDLSQSFVKRVEDDAFQAVFQYFLAVVLDFDSLVAAWASCK